MHLLFLAVNERRSFPAPDNCKVKLYVNRIYEKLYESEHPYTQEQNMSLLNITRCIRKVNNNYPYIQKLMSPS